MSEDPEILILEKTKLGGGITFDGSSNEEALVEINPEDTENLAPRKFQFYLTGEGSDNTYTLSEGVVEITDKGGSLDW